MVSRIGQYADGAMSGQSKGEMTPLGEAPELVDWRAERKQKERLNDMFAALSETNEAIMRARTRSELFERVCHAAVHGGPFSSATIALAEPGSVFLRIAVAEGPNAEQAKTLKLATTPDLPQGRGVSGEAFRTRRICISNNYLADPRTVAFYDKARAGGGRACAALPLLNRGEVVGVMLLVSQETDAFNGELVALLERLADNVSFALENFDRADERLVAERQRERLTRMYTALSATNEAIMRAGTREELFAWVCEAAVKSGDFATRLGRADGAWLGFPARSSPSRDPIIRARCARPSVRPIPEGRGVSGVAFRTRRPCISNDYLADERGAAFHDARPRQQASDHSQRCRCSTTIGRSACWSSYRSEQGRLHARSCRTLAAARGQRRLRA